MRSKAVPESKPRKAAATKTRPYKPVEPAAAKKPKAPSNRQWVPPTFITVGLVGVMWLVVYYLTASVGITIPYFSALASWNVLIGMGLMAASFGIATLWK
jgi:hypothetical protein